MLYKKNGAPFSEALFRDPTCEYRGTPFWAWNCKLEREELLRQINVMREMGFGGFHMHVRTGMATDYLSPEYMELVRACVDEAKDKKMLAWLYDEDRWPSGAAGGKVTREERFRSRSLRLSRTPLETEPADPAKGRATLLACYDVVLDATGALASYRRIGQEETATGRKWYAYLCISDLSAWYNGFTYVDTLNPEAIRRFLEVTHEVYADKVGDEFGKAVPAIFSDEPQFSHKKVLRTPEDETGAVMPWTDDVPETFRAAYGEDILAHLPELFWDLPVGQISTVRYHYHDHIAERFASAFADVCGKWCDEHGILLTGHMMNEPSLRSQTESLGDAMRSYRSFGLPGIDMLCNLYEFTTAKQAQSAVQQYGREGLLSELYGVTGWDYDLQSHKLQGDWQAALGVTVRVPHLAWLSMNGEAKRDYPASINYQSPWYTEYSYIENHFARVNVALTRGRPVVRVGVVHPVESYWLHYGPNSTSKDIREQMDSRFLSLTRWLLFNHIDFNFISESLLPSQCAEGGAPLTVGKMAYDVVIVPGCETLRGTTLERLSAFAAQGGRLIFVGDAPKYLDAVASDAPRTLWERSLRLPFDQIALVDALEEVRELDITLRGEGSRCRRFVHQLREDNGERWLFLAPNQMPDRTDVSPCANAELILRGEYEPTLYDTISGTTRPVAHTAEDGKTHVFFSFYEEDSFLFRLTPKAGSRLDESELPQELPVGQIDWVRYGARGAKQKSGLLDVPDTVAYTRSEPNVLLLDQAEYALDDGEFSPREELLRADDDLRRRLGWAVRQHDVVQPYMIEEAKAPHTVRLRFRIQSEIETPATLALEDADVARITLNGRAVTAAPDGWYVDRCIRRVPLGTLPAGESVLEVAIPFGQRTNIEWCYLLGDFGVRLAGRSAVLVAPRKVLGFDSITMQDMPFYGGNVTYEIPFESHGGKVTLLCPHYRGGILRAEVDGADAGHICLKPYSLALGALPAGKHTLRLTLFGNRVNSFGAVHCADRPRHTQGPNTWRTLGAAWTYEYRLYEIGLLTAPLLREE